MMRIDLLYIVLHLIQVCSRIDFFIPLFTRIHNGHPKAQFYGNSQSLKEHYIYIYTEF